MKTSLQLVLAIVLLYGPMASAQEGLVTDAELEETVNRIGRQATIDSCRKTITTINATLSSSEFQIPHDLQVAAVRCARWLGLLGDQRSLPLLEQVLAHKRTTDRLSPTGRYLLDLQGSAFMARVDLLIKAGNTAKAFDELIALFKQAPRSHALTLHERDMIDFARVELASRDEFYPMLLAFAQKEYLPLSMLRAEGSEARYESFLDFKRIASADSPAERDAVIGLVVHKSADVRALGVELLDLSGETVDTLITMIRTRRGKERATLRQALQNIDSTLTHMIEQSRVILKAMPEESLNREAIRQDTDLLVGLREKIGRALKK